MASVSKKRKASIWDFLWLGLALDVHGRGFFCLDSPEDSLLGPEGAKSATGQPMCAAVLSPSSCSPDESDGSAFFLTPLVKIVRVFGFGGDARKAILKTHIGAGIERTAGCIGYLPDRRGAGDPQICLNNH
jgi:hypothetical protein